MNVQAHISGQISGQLPNQGTHVPIMPEPNGNVLPSQMQHIAQGHPRTTFQMDSELIRMRTFMHDRM